MENLGDKIASVATPIARALRLPCIDPVTQQLRSDSDCNKMRMNLNAGMSLADAFYDRFWPSAIPNASQELKNTNNKQEKQTMQYIVNKTQTEQIAIDAENPKDAIEKVKNGEGQITSTSENCSATPRPTPIQQPQVR
jgi:hypothetical protein